MPDALSRRHYDVEFNAELEEARHLGIIVKSQEMREAERREFDEQEGIVSPEEDEEDNPLSRIDIESIMPRVAVLTRGRAAATGGDVSGPLVHHRKRRTQAPQKEGECKETVKEPVTTEKLDCAPRE